jgi:hypothetical protein
MTSNLWVGHRHVYPADLGFREEFEYLWLIWRKKNANTVATLTRTDAKTQIRVPTLPQAASDEVSPIGGGQDKQPASHADRTSEGSAAVPVLQKEVRRQRYARTHSAVSEETAAAAHI